MNITFRQMVESYQNKTLNEVDGQYNDSGGYTVNNYGLNRYKIKDVASDPDISFDKIQETLKHHDEVLHSGKSIELGSFYNLLQHSNSLTVDHKRRIIKQMSDNNKILSRTPNSITSQYNMAGEREERMLMGDKYDPNNAVLK